MVVVVVTAVRYQQEFDELPQLLTTVVVVVCVQVPATLVGQAALVAVVVEAAGQLAFEPWLSQVVGEEVVVEGAPVEEVVL